MDGQSATGFIAPRHGWAWAPAGPQVVDRPLLASERRPDRDREPELPQLDARPPASRAGTVARSVEAQHSARLLLVDDDEKRAGKIKAVLEQQGFAVVCAGDGPACLALVAEQMPDLLILNAVLPRMPGIDVCRHLRRAGSEVPIIVLSPRSDEIDVVVTMEMGADDFIAEPYGMRELVARIRAVLRRSKRSAVNHSVPAAVARYVPVGRQPVRSPQRGAQHGGIVASRFGLSRTGISDEDRDGGPDILKVGDLSLDRARHEVLLRGKAVDLPRREFMLLEALLERPGRLLTREVLIERIWGPGFWGSSKILSTLVGRLRALIEWDAEEPTRIVTIRGIGYRYEVPSEGNA